MHDVACEFACAVAMRTGNGRERPYEHPFGTYSKQDIIDGAKHLESRAWKNNQITNGKVKL